MQLEELLANYRLVDLTHILEEGPPCLLPYYHMVWTSRKLGDPYNAYVLQIPEHHGTHVDAPFHAGGKKWLDDLDLNVWHGPCRVIDLKAKKLGEETSALDIKRWEKTYGSLRYGDIVLLQYGWDKRWPTKNEKKKRGQLIRFFRDFPGLSVEAADYLGKSQVKLVGTDTPTVDPVSAFIDSRNFGKTEPAHVKLLRECSIPVLEGLRNLSKLPPNGAYLFTFPLSLRCGSGSPVRAVAFVPRR